MLLQKRAVSVQSTGEHVVVAMGSSSWTMHYETALRLSFLMRMSVRAARRFCGDMGPRMSARGIMHDAEKGPDYGQPFTPGKVYPVNRNVLKQVDAKNDGMMVAVHLGKDVARMPYQAAQEIGQWLRLRAKECKRRVGDQRHWERIVEAA